MLQLAPTAATASTPVMLLFTSLLALAAAAGVVDAATPPLLPRPLPSSTTTLSLEQRGGGGLSIPIRHGGAHGLRRRSDEALQYWAARERIRINGKYGPGVHEEAEARLRARRREGGRSTVGGGHGGDDSDDNESERRRSLEEQAAQKRNVRIHARQDFSLPPSASSSTASWPNSTATTTAVNTRNLGIANLTNWESDLEYYAPLYVGTPPQLFNVILDTGSADTWLVDSNCTTRECVDVSTFTANRSTTASSSSRSFSIAYGAGIASGTMWNETISLAGRTLSNQTLGLADSVGTALIAGNASGIMGLGFPALSATRSPQIWQSFINMSNSSSAFFPGFSFYFTRYINATNASHAEPGGLFTLGTLSNSSHTGAINWVDIPSGSESYWVIPMQGLKLNGQNLTGFGNPTVAIDTGTTLIGGPTAIVEQLYTQIGGAYALDGAYEGYYTYPCNASVNVAFQFGNVTYNMTAEDLNLGIFRENQCLGAFFDLTLSPGSAQVISWVIGGAFLKNVYSVFRYTPRPAVGFARLSPAVLSIDNPALPGTQTASISASFPTGIVGPTGARNSSSVPTGSKLPPGTTSMSQTAGRIAQDQIVQTRSAGARSVATSSSDAILALLLLLLLLHAALS